MTRLRRLCGQAATVFGVAVTSVAALPTTYLALTTVVAARAHRTRRSSHEAAPATRFVIVVPAHDEAGSITSACRALVDQAYPREMFEVHVVADNCRDDTSGLARATGAVVHERFDLDQRGKGAALNWFSTVCDTSAFDVVVVIDADTVAEPQFLAALDRSFVNGAQAVQGYYGVADPQVSPSIALRYAAIACRHHLRPLARTAMGASCGLYGNGMAFRSSLFADRRWSDHLIEDAEFQMELLQDGSIVAYAPEAVVTAEMPSSLEAATTQNQRWELGRLQLVRRYVPDLFAHLLRGGPVDRRVYADAVADHLTPSLSLLLSLDLLAGTLGAASLALHPTRTGRLTTAYGFTGTLVLLGHVLLGLRLVSAPAVVYRSLLDAPRLVLWKVSLLTGVVRRPRDVAWTRTTRNSDLQDATT